MDVPVGLLAHNACYSASSTNVVSIDDDTRQPTILLANTSMMNATYAKPCQMLTYVKFATHS